MKDYSGSQDIVAEAGQEPEQTVQAAGHTGARSSADRPLSRARVRRRGPGPIEIGDYPPSSGKETATTGQASPLQPGETIETSTPEAGMPPEAKESVEHQGERSGEGDYDQAGAERDRDRLYERLDGLSDQVGELRGKTEDLDSRVQVIQEDIDDLKDMFGELVAGGGGQSAGAMFEPVAQLSVIEDDVQSAAEDSDKPRGFFDRLRKMFRGIWALLWRLLSRFRAVKEWSLSGELGPVLGKVAVSVTFGRS